MINVVALKYVSGHSVSEVCLGLFFSLVSIGSCSYLCVCVSEYFWLLAGHSPWKITHRPSSGGWLCVSHPLPPLQRFASVLPFVPEQWQLDPLGHIEGPQVSRFCDTELHGSREFFPLFPLPPSLPPSLSCSVQHKSSFLCLWGWRSGLPSP